VQEDDMSERSTPFLSGPPVCIVFDQFVTFSNRAISLLFHPTDIFTDSFFVAP